MERGGSSNIEHKYTRRARPSGIVIWEGRGASAAAAPAANIPGGEVNQERQAAAFKREVDQYMPIPNITRIMRRVLPTHARIADDAKEAIQECVSEFISFITAEANGRCNSDYRSTVTPEDVLAAMASLGFDDYVEPLSVFLSKHRAKEYPERGSTSQLPQFVRRDCSRFLHPPQSAQIVRPLPPPPPPTPVTPTVGYYTPLPPDAGATEEDGDEFGGSMQAINEYFWRNHAGGPGGEGTSDSRIVIRAGPSTTAADPIVAANFPAGEVNQERQAAAFKREANQYMPIANITRIMRRVLPTHVKIAADGFISFVTTEANGRCNRDYRSTVTPEDVLAAMASLGFDDYVEPLSVFLSKHRAKEYPERGSTSQMPQFVRRDGSRFVHQPQSAQMVRPLPPPPPPPVTPTVGYTPLPPDAGATVEDKDEYGGSMQAINEYILRNHAGGPGGEGTPDGREFDPF